MEFAQRFGGGQPIYQSDVLGFADTSFQYFLYVVKNTNAGNTDWVESPFFSMAESMIYEILFRMIDPENE